MSKMEKQIKKYDNKVLKSAYDGAKRKRFKKEHPGYRPTCCGREDWIIDTSNKRYFCKHCMQEYLLDIYPENWGPDK